MSNVINVAGDFSKYPAGRYITDGPYSAEALRNLIIPKLNKYDRVIVELDGTMGYSAAFLEECFGGLSRNGFSVNTIRTKLRFLTVDALLELEIWVYIDEAESTAN